MTNCRRSDRAHPDHGRTDRQVSTGLSGGPRPPHGTHQSESSQLPRVRGRSSRRRASIPGRVVGLASAPAALLLVVVFALPILETVRLSFSSWGGLGPVKFVGLANLRELLASSAFYHSIYVTLLFAVLATAGIVAFATTTAVVTSRGNGPLVRWLRVIWFLPAIAPGAAIAVFWATAFQPFTGAVNTILGAIGMGHNHSWLADPHTALFVIVAVTIWASVAFPYLLLLGAIQRIPTELYEAAQLDGAAGGRRQLRYITLPLVQPVLIVVTVLEFIWCVNGFTLVWGITKGGPADATTTLPVLLYQQAFLYNRYGIASAISVIASGFLLLVGAVGLGMARSRTEAR